MVHTTCSYQQWLMVLTCTVVVHSSLTHDSWLPIILDIITLVLISCFIISHWSKFANSSGASVRELRSVTGVGQLISGRTLLIARYTSLFRLRQLPAITRRRSTFHPTAGLHIWGFGVPSFVITYRHIKIRLLHKSIECLYASCNLLKVTIGSIGTHGVGGSYYEYCLRCHHATQSCLKTATLFLLHRMVSEHEWIMNWSVRALIYRCSYTAELLEKARRHNSDPPPYNESNWSSQELA